MGSGSSVARGSALSAAFRESEKSRIALPESIGSSHASLSSSTRTSDATKEVEKRPRPSPKSELSIVVGAADPPVETDKTPLVNDSKSAGGEGSNSNSNSIHVAISVAEAEPRGRAAKNASNKNKSRKNSVERSKSPNRSHEGSHSMLSPVLRGRRLVDSALKSIGEKVHIYKKHELVSKELKITKRYGEWFVQERNVKSNHCTQFLIEECEQCCLRVHDVCDTGFIQDCKNCSIVIGPTADSIYIRDCSNCKLIVACRQLRIYDCQNMEIQLFCSTHPSIESCENIKFSCYNYKYPNLAEHFPLAQLSVYENSWSEVYNFTPNSKSFTLVNDPRPFEEFLEIVTDKGVPATPSAPNTAQTVDQLPYEYPVVPLTLGPLVHGLEGSDEMCVVLVFPSHVESTIAALQDSGLYLVRTRTSKLTKKDVLSLFLDPNDSHFQKKAAAQCGKGPFISAEVRGKGCHDILKGLMEKLNHGSNVALYVTHNRDSATLFTNSLFSETADKGHEFEGSLLQNANNSAGPSAPSSEAATPQTPTKLVPLGSEAGSPKSPSKLVSVGVGLDDSFDGVEGGAPVATVLTGPT